MFFIASFLLLFTSYFSAKKLREKNEELKVAIKFHVLKQQFFVSDADLVTYMAYPDYKFFNMFKDAMYNEDIRVAVEGGGEIKNIYFSEI